MVVCGVPSDARGDERRRDDATSASAEGGGDVIVDAVERAARGDVEGEGEEPKETGTEEKGGDVDGVVGDDVSSAKRGAERGPV